MKIPSDLHDDYFSVELYDDRIEISIDWDTEFTWKAFDLNETKLLRNKLTEMIEYLEALENYTDQG